MSELHIWTTGEDWVIAENANDALLVASENAGYPNPADYQSDTGEMPGDWKRVNDGPFGVNVEDEGRIVKHTSVWIAEQGRGWLCGTNC